MCSDEDDTITISTNEELEIALDEMSKRDKVSRLYVILLSDRERGDLPEMPHVGKTLHPGIICDVCDKSIRGFRFKCMQCPDYDLCTDCMALGYHPEHYMVRMTEPLEWSGYHGRRLAHHMRKFMKKTSSSSHGGRDDETRKCPFRSGNSGGKRSSCPVFHAAGGKVRFDPSVIDPLEDFIKNMYVPLEESCHEPKRSAKSKDQRRDPSAEAATEATEDPQQEATRHSFSQLLKIFEDNISQFLDPLGINVIVTADNDNATKNKPATGSTETATATAAAAAAAAASATAAAAACSSTSPKDDDDKKFPGEGRKLLERGAKIAPVTSENASQDQAPAQKPACPEQAAEADEWTMVTRESPNISRASSTSSSLNGAIPKQVCCGNLLGDS